MTKAMAATLAERCSRVELLILDVDGVLTDGGIVYADNGVEIKAFHVRDGSGLKVWEKTGKKSAVLSGRTSSVVEIRAREAGITRICQGVINKLPVFQQLLADFGLKPEQACFVGDDILDLSVLRSCGLAVAVADACPEVIAAAQFVTKAHGGRGAVREVIELILHSQGKWQSIVGSL